MRTPVLTVGRLVAAAPVVAGLSVLTLLPQVPRAIAGLLAATVGLAGTAGVLAGVRRYRPAYPASWYLAGAGMLCAQLGGLLVLGAAVADRLWPAPGPPDVLILALYPLVAAALVLWLHRQGSRRDIATGVDVAIVVTALGTLTWLAVVVPSMAASRLGLGDALVAAAYPCGDLILLGAVVRMLLDPGRSVPALRLLAAGLGCLLLTHTAYLIIVVSHGTAPGPMALIACLHLVGGPLAGAAALHPSMLALQHRSVSTPAGLSGTRVLVLGAALLVGPLALWIEHARGSDRFLGAYAIVSGILSVLAMLRMWLLVVEQRRLTITDGLTGMRTRRYFEEALATEVARQARSGEPFGVLLIDVDHFKRINDTYGHGAGDLVLQELSRRLTNVVRTGDVVARYGGEEFAVLLSHADRAATLHAAERIRGSIGDDPMPVADGAPLTVTVSVGACTQEGPRGTSAQLMLQAERCLHAAKERGRNQVVSLQTADAKSQAQG